MSYSYLDDGDILIVNKTLASAIGLNESIALRQIHHWIEINWKSNSEKHYQDGCWWTYNTYEEWTSENFPFLSRDTVRRTLLTLESLGLVETGNYNARPGDQTKWYTINYARFDAFMAHWNEHGCPNVSNRSAYKAYLPIWQVAMTNIASCIGQDSNLHRPLPKTISKTTQRIKTTPLPPVGGRGRSVPKSPKQKRLSVEDAFRQEYAAFETLAEALRKPFNQLEMTPDESPREALVDYLDAAKQLTQANATPGEIPLLYDYVKKLAKDGQWKTFGVKALVKYYVQFKAHRHKQTQPPTPPPAPAQPPTPMLIARLREMEGQK